VLGADRTWSPEQVAELLGDDYGENISSSRSTMWRDHGLVEFFWQRGGTGEPWVGTHFSVQAHRLDDPGTVNPVIRERYGAFPGPVAFDEVVALLTDRGVPLTEVPYPPDPDELRTYRQPGSHAMLYVVAGSYYGQVGDLYKVIGPGTP